MKLSSRTAPLLTRPQISITAALAVLAGMNIFTACGNAGHPDDKDDTGAASAGGTAADEDGDGWSDAASGGKSGPGDAAMGGDTGEGGRGEGGEGGEPPCELELDRASIALSMGHTDVLTVSYLECDNTLRLFLTEDTGLTLRAARAAEQVLIQASDNALVALPDSELFAFLGKPGEEIYMFTEGAPEAQAMGIPWPGYQSYGVPDGIAVDNAVVVHLVSVDGPGDVFLFESPPDEVTPPVMIFNPNTGMDKATFVASTHRHMNWAFTERGLYRLSFQVSIVRASDGKTIISEPETYRFLLGDLEDLPKTEPTVLEIAGGEEVYSPGGSLTLTAVRYGIERSLPTTWLKACSDESTDAPVWVEISEGDSLSLPVENCSYRAVIGAESGSYLATSQDWQPYIE